MFTIYDNTQKYIFSGFVQAFSSTALFFYQYIFSQSINTWQIYNNVEQSVFDFLAIFNCWIVIFKVLFSHKMKFQF